MAMYNPPIVFQRLPDFTLGGLLPPYCGTDPTQHEYVAPYPTTVDIVARQLGGSPKRVAILRGFLAFRQALNQAGICDGLQWLNGSFMELVERREGRDPNDLDVVTFFRRPLHVKDDGDWLEFFRAHETLFNPSLNRQQFSCHGQFVDLDLDAISIVAQTRYWYGLFSHRRVTGEWKGMVEVPLALTPADAAVSALISQGGPP